MNDPRDEQPQDASTQFDSELLDKIADEFARRCRLGESPDIQEYLSKFPEQAAHLKSLLQSVQLLEKAKQQRPLGDSTLKKALSNLHDFRIIREIGKGGMGIVYEAEQLSLQRRVALKVLPHRSRMDNQRFQRFEREAHAAAKLHHSNIVSVYSFGEHDGLHYYVMQYINGRSLAQLLTHWRENPDKIPPLPRRWSFIARIGVEVAQALQHAHEHGILHRDIKPGNILVDRQGTTWVTDFGLAKQVEDATLTKTGDIIGTLQYMAPEQLQSRADERSDLYSLGLTLYELLTLKPAIEDMAPSRLLKILGELQLEPPRKINPEIPLDLETIVLKAIAREPVDRYQTANALATDLKRFLEDEPVEARRMSLAERAWRWARRNLLTTLLSVTLVASLILTSVVGWVGYVRTGKALENEFAIRQAAEEASKRADANVAMSLDAIENMFEKLASRRAGMPGDPDSGEMDHPGVISPEGKLRDPGNKAPPNHPENPPPGQHPPLPHPRHAQDEVELLQSILNFYERFAAANAESLTQRNIEPARAYFRVASLYRLLGKSNKAAEYYRRTVEFYHRQSLTEPLDNKSRLELAVAILSSPFSDREKPALETRKVEILESLSIAEQLVRESEHRPGFVELEAHARVELGVLEFSLGNRAVADKELLQACYMMDQLVDKFPASPTLRMRRIMAYHARADVLKGSQKKEDARTLLMEAVKDLRRVLTIVQQGAPPPPDLRDICDRLVDSLNDLGEREDADILATEATRFLTPNRDQ